MSREPTRKFILINKTSVRHEPAQGWRNRTVAEHACSKMPRHLVSKCVWGGGEREGNHMYDYTL